MAWNKNHFNTISEEIADVRKWTHDTDAETRAVGAALDQLASQLANTFENRNDGFTRKRFYDECGVPADSRVRKEMDDSN